MLKLSRHAALLLGLAAASLFAQTPAVSYINSTYSVALKTVGTVTFTTVSLTVAYPVNLSPGSYILPGQLNTDVQNFNTAYPSSSDPVEAILSSIVTAVLAKYPQMTGATLSAYNITGTGTSIVTATIGKGSTASGVSSGQVPGPISAIIK